MFLVQTLGNLFFEEVVDRFQFITLDLFQATRQLIQPNATINLLAQSNELCLARVCTLLELDGGHGHHDVRQLQAGFMALIIKVPHVDAR